MCGTDIYSTIIDSGTCSQDNTSSSSGMGGSEEAVYYISLELAALGYEVEVYADVIPADDGRVQFLKSHDSSSGGAEAGSAATQNCETARGKVRWRHYSHFDARQPSLAFIAWRYSFNAVALGRSAMRSFIWLHDLIHQSTMIHSIPSLNFGGFFVQSDFHKDYVRSISSPRLQSAKGVSCSSLRYFPVENNAVNSSEIAVASVLAVSYEDCYIKVVPNGVRMRFSSESQGHESYSSSTARSDWDVVLPQSMQNDRNVFVYASAPNRGLYLILVIWSEIRALIPNAVLRVYYGFTKSVISNLQRELGEAEFDRWYSNIQRLLKQDGVDYIGAVDHTTLAVAFSQAGFLLYPSIFQETGCITMMKAMSAGAIPITSRFEASVLRTLGAGFDLGPVVPLTLDTLTSNNALLSWLRSQYLPAVIHAYYLPAISGDAVGLDLHRREMMRYARREFTWKNSALLMAQSFPNVIPSMS
jgi:hypothetical protein